MTHVKHNSGNKEWYTPPHIVETARKVMGEIDLDPASSHKANEIVMAKLFFTLDNPDEAFQTPWWGRVFMNPPYGQPDIVRFTDRFIEEFLAKHIRVGITLTNNATETRWFQSLAKQCVAICFLERRIKFLDDNLKPAHSPLQGQAIMLFDGSAMRPYVGRFYKEFRDLGLVVFT